MQTSNITTEELEFSQELLQFIDECPSPFHTVESIKKILTPIGFTDLNPEEKWSLVPGGNIL